MYRFFFFYLNQSNNLKFKKKWEKCTNPTSERAKGAQGYQDVEKTKAVSRVFGEGCWTGAGALSGGHGHCRLHPGGRERMPDSGRSHTELDGEGTQRGGARETSENRNHLQVSVDQKQQPFSPVTRATGKERASSGFMSTVKG